MSKHAGKERQGPARRCCGECCYVTACFPCYNTLVWRCRLKVSKAVLKALIDSALEATI